MDLFHVAPRPSARHLAFVSALRRYVVIPNPAASFAAGVRDLLLPFAEVQTSRHVPPARHLAFVSALAVTLSSRTPANLIYNRLPEREHIENDESLRKPSSSDLRDNPCVRFF
jgi:hypothetical protein